MESRAFGRGSSLRYPAWLNEGYADYVAKAGDFDMAANARALRASAFTRRDPAYLDNINSTSNTLDLICTDARLDQYIKADKYKIRTKVTLKETLSKDVTVKAEMKFRVTADPF